jgi:hypothetical protein
MKISQITVFTTYYGNCDGPFTTEDSIINVIVNVSCDNSNMNPITSDIYSKASTGVILQSEMVQCIHGHIYLHV